MDHTVEAGAKRLRQDLSRPHAGDGEPLTMEAPLTPFLQQSHRRTKSTAVVPTGPRVTLHGSGGGEEAGAGQPERVPRLPPRQHGAPCAECRQPRTPWRLASGWRGPNRCRWVNTPSSAPVRKLVTSPW